MSERHLPLAGRVVVEMSTSVAGPFAGQVLADLGAEVYKIENPVAGDDARHWGPPFVDGVSPVFQTLNRNKHSLGVNLKLPDDRAALEAFILDRADIVLQNMRPGLVESFGVDAATLRAKKPRLIYGNISAFGNTGPRQMQPGYDPLMQACGGIMSTTGIEGAEPVRVGPSLVDQGSGMWVVIGILTALIEREATGAGATVDTSLFETAVGWMPAQVATYLTSGKVPGRIGTENSGIAPYKAYEAQGGWMVIAAGNNKLFARAAEVMGHPEWVEDPRFASNPKRVENRIALNALVQDIIATRERSDWLARFEAVGVPVAPVLSIDEVVAEPQFGVLNLLQQVPGTDAQLLGLPISFDGDRPSVRTSAPQLGASTDVLAPYRNTEMVK